MKKVLVRCDSSRTIGLGHVMRDLVLAQALQSRYEVMFATRELEGNINNKIKENGFVLHVIASNDIEELIRVIVDNNIDIVVIDHYGIDASFEQTLKQRTGVYLVVLDDYYEKHYCDRLINHNPGADSEKYDTLLPRHAVRQCGIAYTLIRHEFKEARDGMTSKRKLGKKRVKHIMVMMGGSDPKNYTFSIAKSLYHHPYYKLHLVTTSANHHCETLRRLSQCHRNIYLHVNSSHIARLMNQADLAVISPSVTAAEALFMRLPFIAVQTADNQEAIYSYLKQKRLPVLKQFRSAALLRAVEECLANYDTITKRLRQFYFSKQTVEYII